jgi:transcriptional regulator with XRE-family HTH domain
MKINRLLTDDAILAELGVRITRYRVDQSLTQAGLASQSGVSKRTVERVEAGASTQLSSMLRILRVLELLPNLETAIPATEPRPMELLKRRGKGKGKVRQRASSKGQVAEHDEPWSWADKK